MNREQHDGTGKRRGVRLSQLNIMMICIGLVLATLMIVSMYSTTDSVKQIVGFTNNYLVSQQTGGMLRDFTDNLSEQAMAFVQNGEIGPAKAYEAQLKVINEQLELYSRRDSDSAAAPRSSTRRWKRSAAGSRRNGSPCGWRRSRCRNRCLRRCRIS